MNYGSLHDRTFWGGFGSNHQKRAVGKFVFDVAIVGGGLTGLSAAFHLKLQHPALSVGLFEAFRIGSGATGRSGGILVAHPKLFGSVNDVAFLKAFAREFKINCDWNEPKDKLALLDYEYAHELVNPLWLCLELRRLSQSVGVELFEYSPVTKVRIKPNIIHGEEFYAEANWLILATDAAKCPYEPINKLLNTTHQACLAVDVPFHLQMKIPWTFYKELDDGTHYWGRRIRQQFFMFGGSEFNDTGHSYEAAELSRSLFHSLSSVLPWLADSTPYYFWTGPIARFVNNARRGVITVAPGVVFVGGYNGDGIAAAVRSGSILSCVLDSGVRDSDFQHFTISHDGCLIMSPDTDR